MVFAFSWADDESAMELEVVSRRGLRPRARQIDRDLWLWFCRAHHRHQHEGGPRVSKRVVQEEAKRAFHSAGITTFKVNIYPENVRTHFSLC